MELSPKLGLNLGALIGAGPRLRGLNLASATLAVLARKA